MKKALSFILALVVFVTLFASCGTTSNDESVEKSDKETTLTENKEELTDNSKLSKDYRSGQIQIDGIVYTLPLRVKDFSDNGWILSEVERTDNIVGMEEYTGQSINPKAESYGWYSTLKGNLSKNSSSIYVSLVNVTADRLPADEAYINYISIDAEDVSGIEVIIPGGFVLGKATRDEIIAAWGENEYDVYDFNDSDEYEVDFDDNGILEEVTIETVVKNDSIKVDLNGLNGVAAKDTFPVRITDISLVEDGFKEGMVVSTSDDALVFEVENSENTEVSEIIFCVVAYDKDSNAARLNIGLQDYYSSWENDPFINLASTNDGVTVASNETEEIALPINATDLYNVSAIVYSYKTADGQTHTNDLIYEWIDSVYN